MLNWFQPHLTSSNSAKGALTNVRQGPRVSAPAAEVAVQASASEHTQPSLRRRSPPLHPERITMLLENNPYPQDVRVRAEAESLVKAGHHVTVVAPRDRDQPRREEVRGVNVIRFRLPDGSGGGPAGFFVEYFVAGVALHVAAVRTLIGGATVLHLHNPPDIFFLAGALYRLTGRKVVFDHHDLFPETVQVKFGGGMASRIARRCQGLTFAVANHVLATNASYAEVARELGSKTPEQVTIVRNGPPAAWIRIPQRHREGVLTDVRLLYLGAISSQDGVEGLAPVLARLRDGASPVEVHLTIVGDGDGRPALERAFAEHGVADRVSYTGRVAPEQVPRLLEAADICVDPAPATDVNERSTMTKMAEYLALGKPVVAYDLLEAQRTAGDAAMLVRRGDVAAFADAIVQLARNPALRAQLSDEARRRAPWLTWERSERSLQTAYDALRTPSTTTVTSRPHEWADVVPLFADGLAGDFDLPLPAASQSSSQR